MSRACRALIPLVWLVGMGAARADQQWFIVVVTALALVAAVVLSGWRDLRPLFRIDLVTVGVGLLSAAVLIGVTHGGYVVSAALFSPIRSATADLEIQLSAHAGALGVAMLLLVVIAEEFLWRGAFQTLVAYYWGETFETTLLCAAIYAAAVVTFRSPLLVGVAAAYGLFWSALRSWTGNLMPPLIAHVVWSIVMMLVPLSTLLR